MQGLWLSNNTFHEFAAPQSQELLGELAVRGGAIVGHWLGLLPDPDPVLQKSGESATVLEALAADYKVLASTQTRKLKTLCRGNYKFAPGTAPGAQPTPEAIALCNALTSDLERIDLYNLIAEVLDAPYYGQTVAELFWGQEPSRLRLLGIVPKPREWFRYDTNNRLRYVGEDGYGLAMGADAVAMAGAGTLPPFGKIITARHFPTYKNPYGLRLYSRCLFPVAFKKGGIEFMMRFAEKWGMPWVVGTAGPKASPQELREMHNSLVGMVSDAVATVRGGGKVELVQASGQAGDLHLSIVRHWDDAIAQVIAGQTLTSTVGESGSYAASKTHAGILEDYADADATLVKIFFDELAWVYGQINARGVLTPVFTFEDPEDQQGRAELGKKLHETGVRFTPVYFERRFGLAPDEFAVEADKTPQPGTFAAPAGNTTNQPRFTPGQQSIETLVAELLPKGIATADAMAHTILNLVAKAETPEELEQLLAAALAPAQKGGLDTADLNTVLETALFAADMTGRFSARENVE
ncbi:phage portal protein family protein [Desulfovibrio cuneatus]|uniref:phage portal protein family protein n=1 Tax=Desulfovibrio cuneatus TaxID=159728 RepID=UPI0004242205|nr:DUF935 family protein [Desulfovibrio cuneatus]